MDVPTFLTYLDCVGYAMGRCNDDHVLAREQNIHIFLIKNGHDSKTSFGIIACFCSKRIFHYAWRRIRYYDIKATSKYGMVDESNERVLCVALDRLLFYCSRTNVF